MDIVKPTAIATILALTAPSKINLTFLMQELTNYKITSLKSRQRTQMLEKYTPVLGILEWLGREYRDASQYTIKCKSTTYVKKTKLDWKILRGNYKQTRQFINRFSKN